MNKRINTKNSLNLKKAVIFSEFLVLFLVVGSSISMAATESSEKNIVTEPVLSPKNPDFVKYHADKIYTQPLSSSKNHKKGFVPSPVDLSSLSKISSLDISAPAYYDLRALNKVTSVKDQGEAGVCWTFATYGSLESYLMPGENRDFSENNMKNLLSSSYPEGFDRYPNDGGNSFMSTAYLARWSGPVEETDDPYSTYSGVSPGNLAIQKHVQDVLFIPNRESSLDNTEIKSAILQYGTLATSMYFDDTCYYASNNSYYYNGSSISDHAVSIVGWNDNYNKNNFSSVPPGNGAFIVKNSWSTYWGDNGYFYVSYYDSNIGKDNAAFTAETTENYENIYQYDPLGWVLSSGYSNPIAWCANVFTAKSNETLEAISFYTTDSNCAYEIYIYIDPKSGPLSQKGPVLSKTGTIPVAGYHTIPLGSEIQLKTSQKFSIALKLTTPNFGYPIAIEMPLADWSSKATANSGESFISEDGSDWEDVTVSFPDTNVCIKAFTDPESLPDNTAPSSITNLQSTSGTTWINWIWTSPSDSDFNHTEIYLNGIFQTNTSAEFFNATGLQPETNYTIGTRTVDISGNVNETWINDTVTTEKIPFDTLEISLFEGWNLISIPLMPEDTTISSVLSPISGNYSIVWAYDKTEGGIWKMYDPGAPIFVNDLKEIQPGKGYWIMMTANDTLPVSGTLQENSFRLQSRWNLIGYNSLSNKPIDTALAPMSGNYSIVWTYDTAGGRVWKMYDPSAPIFVNDLKDMEPGKGYWIMAN